MCYPMNNQHASSIVNLLVVFRAIKHYFLVLVRDFRVFFFWLGNYSNLNKKKKIFSYHLLKKKSVYIQMLLFDTVQVGLYFITLFINLINFHLPWKHYYPILGTNVWMILARCLAESLQWQRFPLYVQMDRDECMSTNTMRKQAQEI